ncbi:TetR family transcriptional regulator [Asanoa sp. WMMD1127]|uniref:TetR/AcrR family transcriptional regulator n=1 Tax=Asanoa sp. WMMD1127 TaxID=3016107 RepID=UPI0024176787|nr:TetR/AcrR family transcriptional regulator [Asanoa sp. WMMD1127]MDG4826579.1 TetR family transcriptional regulator [Asanoa sp. WMMD1127]
MTQPTSRARNAASTRQAILDAAVTAFTRHGYDGVGVRDIAAAAGVTAMLVNRYFGSKEGLFVEVVDVSFTPPTMVPADPAAPGDLALETARSLVARTDPAADHLSPFELMLKSAANPRAAEIIRAGIAKHVGARLTAALAGPDASQRADLGLALLAGTWLMRTVIGTPALRDADPDVLTDRLARVLAAIVEEEDRSNGT